jgi:hypothetical protein
MCNWHPHLHLVVTDGGSLAPPFSEALTDRRSIAWAMLVWRPVIPGGTFTGNFVSGRTLSRPLSRPPLRASPA